MTGIRAKLIGFTMTAAGLTGLAVAATGSTAEAIVAILLCMAAAILAAGRLARHFTDPIADLKQTIDAYRTGATPVETPLHRRDELGELAWSLRLLVDDLHATHPSPPDRRTKPREQQRPAEDVETAARLAGVDITSDDV